VNDAQTVRRREPDATLQAKHEVVADEKIPEGFGRFRGARFVHLDAPWPAAG